MTPTEGTDVPSKNPEDDEISLLDILIVLAKYKKLVFGLPIGVAIVAAGVSLLMPNMYTGTTKILPPQSQGQSGASALLSQNGGLAGIAGGLLRNPSDVYVAMLKSRTVADNLIARFGLAVRYDTQYPTRVRKKLEERTNIVAGKDNIITIDVDDRDPKIAAELANAYADELVKLTQVLAVTEASQRRLFFEKQLIQAKDNLARAEAEARSSLEQGGIVMVDAQGRALVETSARLRSQIALKEVQIGAMRAFATEHNPGVTRAQQELDALRAQLAKTEGVGKGIGAARDQNGRGGDSLRLLRDVKFYELLFELLGRQYEAAKLDEAKESSVVQVLDKAVEPDLKSKPTRTLIVLISALAALCVGMLLAFIKDSLARTRADPEGKRRMETLRHLLSWRTG
jgi:uncharacterized protein involved in exopolysaccharide biosynthesis